MLHPHSARDCQRLAFSSIAPQRALGLLEIWEEILEKIHNKHVSPWPCLSTMHVASSQQSPGQWLAQENMEAPKGESCLTNQNMNPGYQTPSFLPEAITVLE